MANITPRGNGGLTTLTEPERNECVALLRYRLQSVDAFDLALQLKSRWDQPQSLEIYFNGKRTILGNSNAFINPVLEAGVIHCRALLEFLGLYERDGRVRSGKRRQRGDIGIEQFGLPHVTPANLSVAHGAEQALVAVFHTANKAVAHLTRSLKPRDVTLLLIASQVVRNLFNGYFYVPLNMTPPEAGVTSARATSKRK